MNNLPQAKVYTCQRCGLRTDSATVMREHHLAPLRGYDPCKPKS